MNHDHPAPNDTDPGHHDPDRPTDVPGLDHLHPDRIRIGSVGVFAGDWAWTTRTDGATRIPVGFVGTLIDSFFRTTKVIYVPSFGRNGRAFSSV